MMREDESSRTLSLETMTALAVAIVRTASSHAGIAAPLYSRTPPQRCYRSVRGKAVEPTCAASGVERWLAAALAHMHRIPRHVAAARAVRMAELGARALCREVRVRLRQGEAIRGPVVAGVIETVGVCPALGIRTGQNVMLILGALRHADAWNYLPFGVEHVRLLDVVAVALLVAMQIGDVAGDQHALDIEPGPGADAIARIDTRRIATLFLAQIGAPSAGGVRAEVAGLIGVVGNKEADIRGRCGRSRLGLRHQG